VAQLPDPLDTLTPEARAVYDKISAKRGAVRGPFASLMHHPALAERVGDLGAQQHQQPRRVDPDQHQRHQAERPVHAAVALHHDAHGEGDEDPLEHLEHERRDHAAQDRRVGAEVGNDRLPDGLRQAFGDHLRQAFVHPVRGDDAGVRAVEVLVGEVLVRLAHLRQEALAPALDDRLEEPYERRGYVPLERVRDHALLGPLRHARREQHRVYLGVGPHDPRDGVEERAVPFDGVLLRRGRGECLGVVARDQRVLHALFPWSPAR